MSTSHSPFRKLKSEADKIAAKLKAIERGDALGVPDPAGKIAAARERGSINCAVVMDDKILKIEMPWSMIKESSESGISEFILKHMREARDAVH
ncbi:hypothetical protein [Hyphomicrobium sp. DY-1]|uniref:hypothetical protein n=1 Tax=Hyphomicrobium sp. DY-1 TaxID=3075650 RepID=UPI0039C201CE